MVLTSATIAANLDAFSKLVDDRYALPKSWPNHIGLLLPAKHPEHQRVYDDIDTGTDLELVQLRRQFLIDYEKMQQGWSPTEADLAVAPIIAPIVFWLSDTTLTIGLIGWAKKSGDWVPRRTSMITAWDREHLSWIRTLSRFYVIEAGDQKQH